MTVDQFIPNKMAGTMALFWLSLVLTIIGSHASGELSILHNPESLKFSGSNKVLESLVKEIYCASLGLSVEAESEWKGLYITDPFSTPEAVVEVYVDGVSSLGGSTGLKATDFPVVVDEYEPDTFQEVSHRIKQHYSNTDNKLIFVDLSYPQELSSPSFVKVFGNIAVPKVTKQTFSHLKYSVEEDLAFLNELELLKAITQKVNSGIITPDAASDFYSFRLRSMHALSDYHGANSLQAKEAKQLLSAALSDLSSAFNKAYSGNVLVTVLTTDVAHTRRVARAAPTVTGMKLAIENDDGYAANYPAIFNIMLWFGVAFAFTLIAIVYAIMDMDPGRDSIIYRMTNTRLKKDN